MAFFVVNASEENVRDFQGNGNNFLNKSGMYDVIVKNVIVDTSKNGSTSINLYVEYEGTTSVIYNAIRLTNNDGSPNKMGTPMFSRFCVVSGATDGVEIQEPVSVNLPIGKGGEAKECMILQEFEDIPMAIRLQMHYSLYDGKIQERREIRNFFTIPEHATAAEIVNNSEEKGKQYELELEYADKTKYDDDLTEEDITEWIKNGRNGGAKKEETPKSRISFGQKRVFGKN